MTPEQSRRSLLVFTRSDTFGDALIKLPAVAALPAAFPGYRVTWLAGRGPSLYAGALSYAVEGVLDEVIDRAGVGGRWRELLRPPLGGRHFEVIIDTQRSIKSTLILRRIPHRLFVSAAGGFRFSDRRPAPGVDRPQAVLNQVMELISLAAGRPVAPVHGVRLPPAHRALAARLLPPGPTYVGLAPGAGQARKCWPLDRFIALARTQLAAGRVPVFILGPGERHWAARLGEAVAGGLFPLPEDCDPLLTIALAERLAVSVANDAGAGHMLAAGGRPLVSLFGPTPVEKFAPHAARLVCLRARDFGGEHMTAIPLQAVRAAVDGLLAP